MSNLEKVRHPRGFLDGLSQPLNHPDSVTRIAICSAIAVIPVFNLVYLAGYKMEIMKRVARQEEDFLPDPAQVLPICLEGLRMVMVGLVYYLIPLLGLFLAELGVIQHLLDFDQVLEADSIGEGLRELFDWSLGLLMRMLLLIIWDLLMDPVLMSAKMHYARHGRMRTFFNLPRHAFAALRDFVFHLKAGFFSLFFWTVAFIVQGFMSATIIGGFLFPFLVAALYAISTGYEYGAHAQTQD
jgi:hypothetical protein